MYEYSAGLETRQDVFSLLTGLQWNILRKPVTPFFGLGFSASWFGALEANIIDDTLTTFRDMDEHAEGGAFLSGGVRMNLNRSLIVEIQARYAVNNLLTKAKSEENIENRYLGLNFIYLIGR